MNLTIENASVTVVRYPAQFLDASNSREFKETMAPVLESHTCVVLDLSRAQFVDSSGLGAILSCLRRLNGKGGDLKVCGLTKPVRALFELVRMHKLLDIAASEQEAIAKFGPEAK